MTKAYAVVLPIFCLALACNVGSAQAQNSAAKAPAKAKLSPELFLLNEDVVTRQWPAMLGIVNAPADLEKVEPGQCVRLGVISTGDQRDRLLDSINLSFDISVDGKVQNFGPEPMLAKKQIKPEGGDFVNRALGVAGIKSPIASFVSLATPQSHWCVPANIGDQEVTVQATATLKDGKIFKFNRRVFQVKSFETARKNSSLSDREKLGSWLQSYYRSPDPAQLLNAMRIVANDPNLSAADNVKSFFVAALKSNQLAQEDIAHQLPKESVSTQMYAIPLLRFAGYDLEPLLNTFSDDRRKALRATGFPDPYDMTPDQQLPSRMDMIWGIFFATGDIEPVKKIVLMLAWHDDYVKFAEMRRTHKQPTALTESIMRAVSYSAAGWSLESLSMHDGVVSDYVEALKQSPDTPQVLRTELAGLDTNPAFTRQ